MHWPSVLLQCFWRSSKASTKLSWQIYGAWYSLSLLPTESNFYQLHTHQAQITHWLQVIAIPIVIVSILLCWSWQQFWTEINISLKQWRITTAVSPYKQLNELSLHSVELPIHVFYLNFTFHLKEVGRLLTVQQLQCVLEQHKGVNRLQCDS